MAKKGKLKTGMVVWYKDNTVNTEWSNGIVSAQILGIDPTREFYMILNLTDECVSYKEDRAPYVYEMCCEDIDKHILDCVSQVDVKAVWKDIYNAPNKGVYQSNIHGKQWQKPITV